MISWRRTFVLIVSLSAVLLPVVAQAQAPPGGLLPGQSVTLTAYLNLIRMWSDI